MILLEKITKENYRACLNLKVSEDQKYFVSSTTDSLAKAYVFYDIVTPFAIYNDDEMVGFMMLRLNEEFNNYFIWQFMIDEKHQGKGYGTQAMNTAIEWMKKDQRCHEIVLTYMEGNEQAKKLYTGLGFEQMSETLDGEIDMVLHF